MSLNKHNLKSLYLLHSEYNSNAFSEHKDEGYSEIALVAYARPCGTIISTTKELLVSICLPV